MKPRGRLGTISFLDHRMSEFPAQAALSPVQVYTAFPLHSHFSWPGPTETPRPHWLFGWGWGGGRGAGGGWTLDGGLQHPEPHTWLPFLVQGREERVPGAGASIYIPALADPSSLPHPTSWNPQTP